ncbi:hypothetical protein Mapa_009378 [Marchantia paleacea]|nr:hypothetical protein Mapa_009378 [Marchantia paleacea]
MSLQNVPLGSVALRSIVLSLSCLPVHIYSPCSSGSVIHHPRSSPSPLSSHCSSCSELVSLLLSSALMAASTTVDQVASTMAKTDLKGEPQAKEVSKDSKTGPAEKDAKAGAVVWTGHDESMKKAVALMEQFGLPLGLLPLEDVQELGFVESTGYMWITQKKKVEHTFKLISKQVSYAEEVKGYVEKGKIRKLSGVKAKELFLWVPVIDITVDGDQITFKSYAGVNKVFAAQAFAAGQ